jgi:hypothetical protein
MAHSLMLRPLTSDRGRRFALLRVFGGLRQRVERQIVALAANEFALRLTTTEQGLEPAGPPMQPAQHREYAIVLRQPGQFDHDDAMQRTSGLDRVGDL